MKDIQFYKSFYFFTVERQRYHHTDNSGGIEGHYLARMLCGTGRIVTVGGRELHVKAGDVLYLPAGLRYRSYWYGDPTQGDRVAWESYRFAAFPERETDFLPQTVTAPGEEVQVLLDRLGAQKTVCAHTVGLLYQVLGLLLPQFERRADSAREQLAARAESYIEENPHFRVSELARHCGMSESGLYAFFKRELNTTPLGMRNRIKIKRAVALLEETDLSVEEVAWKLGFGNAAYFRKVFREVTGKTPVSVRRAAKLM